MVAASIDGVLPGVDVAIFADTGAETQSTYDTVAAWTPFFESKGIRVVRADVWGRVTDCADQSGHFAAVPFYTVDAGGKRGRLKRQCTTEYKVRPIRRSIRLLLGKAVTGRLAVGLAEQWIGYTREEVGRLKPSRVAFLVDRFPWIELGWFRWQVEEYLRGFARTHLLPMPRASACWMCPFRDDWHVLPDEEIARAVSFDTRIRDLRRRGVAGQLFLHRSCQPLPQVVESLRSERRAPVVSQLAFAMECGGGGCGT